MLSCPCSHFCDDHLHVSYVPICPTVSNDHSVSRPSRLSSSLGDSMPRMVFCTLLQIHGVTEGFLSRPKWGAISRRFFFSRRPPVFLFRVLEHVQAKFFGESLSFPRFEDLYILYGSLPIPVPKKPMEYDLLIHRNKDTAIASLHHPVIWFTGIFTKTPKDMGPLGMVSFPYYSHKNP